MSRSYCIFCGTPTYNPNLLCSEDCYDGHNLALEETKCPTCGPAEDCTCSYTPAPLEECEFCGEVFCVCERGTKWDDVDDEFYYEPPDCDLWNER